MSKLRIAVDAGHGTNTPGKRTPPLPADVEIFGYKIKKGEQYKEHYANVFVANMLVQELTRCGFKTIKTGFDNMNPTNDEDTPLSTRQKMIANANCDYAISVHFNAHGDGAMFTDANGVGIYIHNNYINQSDKMAKIVLKQLVSVAGQKDRGVTKQSLAMCNCNNMDVKGAILLELAFMTNQKEAMDLMASEEYLRNCAIATAKGMCEFVGIKYVEESTSPTKTITKESTKEDVKWLQEKLNKVLVGESNIPLNVDGDYGNKTRIAVLIYWEKLGWNKDGSADGWRAGIKTIKVLN